MQKTPFIIAHRGGAGIAPENTVIAIETAKALQVDKIEIDVRLTPDGTLTVFHDRRLNRTTVGRGKSKKHSFAQLREYPIRTKLAGPYGSILIPSLEEILKVIQGSRINLMVEIKSPATTPRVSNILAQLAHDLDVVEQLEVFSFDRKFMVAFNAQFPEFKTGWLTSHRLPKITYPSLPYIGLYYKSALRFPRQLARLKQKGYGVYVWTVNSRRSMEKVIALGVDGIITDYPNILKEVLQEKKPSV